MLFLCGNEKELQKNSRAAQKKEDEISETISQMKQDIQSLNEKVLAQEQELADYKKNAQVQGETAENPQKETTEENAMIGPPARPALSADQLQPGQIIDISQIQGSENTFFRNMRFWKETLYITGSTENLIMKTKI